MGKLKCSVEGCGEDSLSKGLCGKHYVRFRRHGDPNKVCKTGPKVGSKPGRKVRSLEVLSCFKKQIGREGFIPSLLHFLKENNLRVGEINSEFGSYQGLEDAYNSVESHTPPSSLDESSFTGGAFEKLERDVQKYRKFFVTTVIAGSEPDKEALKGVLNFCEAERAKLLVLISSDSENTKLKKYKFPIHPSVPRDSIVFRDLKLNDKLYLSSVKANSKQLNPLTGLRNLASISSCIIASPKQCLEAIATFNTSDFPQHLMTTGTISKPSYSNREFIRDRSSVLAETAHVMGGLVVEIKNSEVSFTRQVQIQEDGSFCDLDKKYELGRPPRKNKVDLMQLPDWHCGSVHEPFREAAKRLCSELMPSFLTLEDFCDNISINPHIRDNISVRNGQLRRDGFKSLKEELDECQKELASFYKDWLFRKLIVKWGNHDDFLTRWLSEAQYSKDVINHYTGVCLAKDLLEGKNPFEVWMKKGLSNIDSNNVEFLTANDSFKVSGIENIHGHLGAGGKRGPGIKGLEAYGPSNSGHTHAPAILGGAFRVGTATDLQLSYNIGPSAWSHTLLVQHGDSSRQLVTVFEGEYRVDF